MTETADLWLGELSLLPSAGREMSSSSRATGWRARVADWGGVCLLSTTLASEWLQIDTDLLRIITSTADELSIGTNIDDLERPWNRKIASLSAFFATLGCDSHSKSDYFRRYYTGDRPRQPAYQIKLMLSRVSWALASISCFFHLTMRTDLRH